MRKLMGVLFISVFMLIAGMAGGQVAGDTGPGGNGSLLPAVQIAGDTGPGGNG